MSLRTVRHWDAGRNRVPWSVVRLLRLLRCGDLGALHDEWTGWTINRLGLHAPAGRSYRERDMRAWWLTCEQARLFREAYDRDTLGGVGAQPLRARERVTLLPGAMLAGPSPEAAPCHPIGAVFTPTAFPGGCDWRASAPAGAGAGKAVGAVRRLGRSGGAARSAGLVSSSQQVERRQVESRWRRRFVEVSCAG